MLAARHSLRSRAARSMPCNSSSTTARDSEAQFGRPVEDSMPWARPSQPRALPVHRTGEGQSWQCRHGPRTAPNGQGPAHGAMACGWTEGLIPQALCHLRGCRRSRSRSDFSSWRRPLRAASGSERDKIAMGQIFLTPCGSDVLSLGLPALVPARSNRAPRARARA